MTKKNSTLIKESVARRWGKLANMPALTENWLETLAEDDPAEEEVEAMDDMEKAEMGDDPEAEMDYAEGDLERADAGDTIDLESDDAQALIQKVAQTVADMVAEPVEFVVDAEGGADADDDLDIEIEDDEVPAMMHARNREDLDEDKAFTAKKEKAGRDKRKGAEKRGGEGTLAKTKGHGRVDYVNNRDDDLDEDKAFTAKKEKAGRDKRKGAEKRGGEGTLAKTKGHGRVDYVNNRKDESLDLEVVDDEALTEAVLKRVVERLLSRK